MARPAFPNIGWDPTPGDPHDTRQLANKLGRLSSDLGRSLHELQRIECGAWKGKSAEAFVDHVHADLTPLVQKSHDAFHKASRALHTWAGQLEGFQDEADRLERKAGTALDADAEAETKDKDRSETSIQVGKVEGEVEDLEHRYRKAADAIGADFDSASGLAPDEPGFFESLANDIADTWNSTIDWFQEHADDIAMIGDLLSDATALLATIAIITAPFEPLGAIFGAAALITSGLALISHSVAKAAGTDVSWMSIGLDAVGLLPGIGLFGKGVKCADMLSAAGRMERFSSGFQASKISAGTRNMMATGDLAGRVDGGLAIGKRFALGGKFDDIGMITHSSGLRSRIASLADAGYGQGQWLGTKGLDVLSNGRFAFDPLGRGGRAADALIKIGPKIFESGHAAATHPGDRFHAALTSH